MRYSILDPTGNITALVESDVAVGEQPSVAIDIMRRHPKVEQVGFVRMSPACSEAASAVEPLVTLRMAGGEFCGNASMCAAALYLLRRDKSYGHARVGQVVEMGDAWETVWLKVSGAAQAVEARLRRKGSDAFEARIHMPAVSGIELCNMAYGKNEEALPVVMMEGISHIVIQESSSFFDLREHPFDAEQAVCTWCEALRSDGLGLMFLEGADAQQRMTPLVYVPGSGTVFWENSCASGSAAVGSYLAKQAGAAVSLSLNEPGGVLCVESNAESGETWLQGNVRFEECFNL